MESAYHTREATAAARRQSSESSAPTEESRACRRRRLRATCVTFASFILFSALACGIWTCSVLSAMSIWSFNLI